MPIATFQRLVRVAQKAYPSLRVGLLLDEDFDFDPLRGFAYCTDDQPDGSLLVGICPKLLTAPPSRKTGVLMHELGHAVLLYLGVLHHTERDADRVAERLFGVKLYYDMDDVQTVGYGVRPRPAYLDDQQGRTRCTE